jgi:hypothetical protein
VEFFLEREAAEAIGEVRKDEPVLTEKLRVEAIESTSRAKTNLEQPTRARFPPRASGGLPRQ